MASFVVIHEAAHTVFAGWSLCLQWGRYEFGEPDHPPEMGYRFIYRRPNGSMQGRGAARIPSWREVEKLWGIARKEGWGEFIGDAAMT